MSPEARFKEIAEQMAEFAAASVSKLENDLQKIKLRQAEIEAHLRSAKTALERLGNFQIKIGGNYQCPACWIDSETKASLRPVGGGTKTEDFFRCDTCGADFNVPSG